MYLFFEAPKSDIPSKWSSVAGAPKAQGDQRMARQVVVRDGDAGLQDGGDAVGGSGARLGDVLGMVPHGGLLDMGRWKARTHRRPEDIFPQRMRSI